MFTGIIEGIGTVEKITKSTKNRSAFQMIVDLGKHAKGLKVGQSVALNGVCLSATKISKNKCNFEMIDETIKKTDLGKV
jgi:riboflavin synthase